MRNQNPLIRYLLPGIVFLAGAGLSIYSWFFGAVPDLKVNIRPANYIMPAAYKVYANPEVLGGRYNLFKAVIQNNGDATVENMKVEYRVPKYINEWTEAPVSKIVLPGQSLVAMAYPSFDQKITEKNSQSREKADIRITYGPAGNRKEINESFSFTMMAANDFAYTDMPATEIASFSDMMQNDALSACFITAEDPVIRYYTGKIQEKILKGETAGVTRTAEEGVRFLKGIYEATLRSGMVYSSTQAVPSNTGDIGTLVQRIRLPRDVISGNTGLCIELSFLYASVMRNAGMDPILFYIPGHAYPGFKLNGQFYAIEATAIGGAGLGGSKSPDEALQMGMKELEEFFQRAQAGDERYYIVDINENIKQGIIPMELKEDAFAKEKIDEMVAKWEGGGTQSQPVYVVREINTGGGNTGGDNTGGGNTGNASGFVQYSKGVNFAYPRGSQVVNRPHPQLPMLETVMRAPDGDVTAEVYRFPGANKVGEALDYLQQLMGSYGLQMSYQQSGTQNGYVLVSGVTNGAAGSIPWIGALRGRGGQVEGVIVASRSGSNPLVRQILATVK